jgi:hypothetical protein
MTDPVRKIIKGKGVEWKLPNGKLHREDGPAIEAYGGYKAWYQHGRRHREDGPAVEGGPDGEEWWFDGYKITREQFLKLNASKYPLLRVYQIMHS